jgi:hypothetical protein
MGVLFPALESEDPTEFLPLDYFTGDFSKYYYLILLTFFNASQKAALSYLAFKKVVAGTFISSTDSFSSLKLFQLA